MKFGLISEGHLRQGETHEQRYLEIVEEVVFAERMGFDFFGTSQHHFAPAASISSPGPLLAFIAARTEQIKLRVMSEVLLTFNHPVLVAERIATIDILSGGRVELCTARSNNPDTLEFFDIAASDTKSMWRESLEIIVRAMTETPFEFQGQFWSLPPRTMQPLPVQKPHPPLFVAATSPRTHQEAGQLGIGVVSGNTVLGWDYLESNLGSYKEAAATPSSPMGKMNTNVACVFSATACCAMTSAEANEQAAPVANKFMDVIMAYNTILAKKSPDYAYIGGIAKLADHIHDLDYLMNHNPYFQIGTPDFLVERFKRIEAMGADEMVLRIDGFGHAENLRSIEMFAKHVFPEFARS